MDFDKKFNYRNAECCDTCSHTMRRPSTGVAWCVFQGCPVMEEICDLYNTDFKTTRTLERLCHRHFRRWEYSWFKNK